MLSIPSDYIFGAPKFSIPNSEPRVVTIMKHEPSRQSLPKRLANENNNNGSDKNHEHMQPLSGSSHFAYFGLYLSFQILRG